jgi:transposase
VLKDRAPIQSTLEFVILDELVPKDHLIREVEPAIDFSFIHDLVTDLYCADNGRPALDPTRLFRLLLLVYLFGIRSECQLMWEV